MTALITNLSISQPTGLSEVGPWPIPDGLSAADIRIQYCTTATPLIWPRVTTTISIVALFSTDVGVTWRQVSSMGTYGGIHVGRGAVEVPETAWFFSVPLAASRLIKFAVTVADGPLVSLLSVNVS